MVETSRPRSSGTELPEERVLIDGAFEAREARGLGLALVDATMNEQRLQDLHSGLRDPLSSPQANDAIDELRALRGQLRELFARAREHDGPVRLKATIRLEFDESPSLC